MYIAFHRCNKNLLLLRWDIKPQHLKVLNPHLLCKNFAHALNYKRSHLKSCLHCVRMKLICGNPIILKHLIRNKDCS